MLTRREFLVRSALAAGGALPAIAPAGTFAAPADPVETENGSRLPQRKPSSSPRVAAVVTVYTPWSHADVIIGRFIQGYSLDLHPRWPPAAVRSLYVDQFPETDLARPLCRRYGIPIASTIREAILDEKGKLAVDGVLLIGEHGDYPQNERGQQLYPRRRFFEETVKAFEEAGECVPVFNDKHLSARWEDAKAMWETARARGIPFLAGSSLPLAWRRPWLELPIGVPLDEALAVGYGPLEAYSFHALETLQCMIERRRGGEAGVKSVECLEGKAVWEALRAGRVSRDLLLDALRRNDPPFTGDMAALEARCPAPVAYLIEHLDGFRSSCLMLDPVSTGFLFAARTTGDARPTSTQLWLQEPTFGHFSYLADALVELVRTGRPPYPVERTVITTGVLSAAMDSRFEGHRRIETPDLKIPYAAVDAELGAYRHRRASNDRHGGWIALFDGKGLDGWRESRFEGEPRWEVVEGVLIGRGGRGYVATWEEFEDLELFAEVRVTGGEKGGCGIRIRSGMHLDRSTEAPEGHEVGLEPAGRWRTMRIRAEGERVRVWVDGEEAGEGKAAVRRGGILLRMGSGGRVEVREMRVRRMDRG